MQHFNYLKTGIPMCEKPDDVGNDFVLFDYEAEGPSCKECPALAAAWAKRQEEGRISHRVDSTFYSDSRPSNTFYYESDDDGSLVQGLMVGIMATSVFWIVLYVVLSAIF